MQCSLCAVGFIIGEQYCARAVHFIAVIVLEIVVVVGIIVVVLVQCILGAVHLIIGTMDNQWRVEWSVVTQNFASKMKYF